jgi:hypothetical protein
VGNPVTAEDVGWQPTRTLLAFWVRVARQEGMVDFAKSLVATGEDLPRRGGCAESVATNGEASAS